ncbi:hypothetical protein M1R55_30500 (plasmid) [Deinococcus sp. QL22]|nr:hypothetical protein M1R55_30500 [Deinococcus sp. QL22]
MRQVWLPGWQPAKWAYEVQHIEVLLQSYEKVQRYEAEGLDYEPWEYLMLTQYSAFLTDQLASVESVFAQHMDRPEYVRHPDHVGWPYESPNEQLPAESWARWSLIRRAWVACLLSIQQQGMEVVWDTPGQPLHGRITRVGFGDFELTTVTAQHQLWFANRSEARLYQLEQEGSVEILWREPTTRIVVDAQTLPVWDDLQTQWFSLVDNEPGS